MDIGTTSSGTVIPYKPQEEESDFVDFISSLGDEDLYDTYMMFQVITVKIMRQRQEKSNPRTRLSGLSPYGIPCL